MSKEYYSVDSSHFNFETLEELIEDLISGDSSVEVGNIITIYCGKSKAIDVKRYTPSIVDDMANNAYDHMGEYSSDFLDVDKLTEQLIQTEVDNFIEGLLTRLDLLPKFCEIEDVREIVVKITDTDCYDFDIVSEEV